MTHTHLFIATKLLVCFAIMPSSPVHLAGDDGKLPVIVFDAYPDDAQYTSAARRQRGPSSGITWSRGPSSTAPSATGNPRVDRWRNGDWQG